MGGQILEYEAKTIRNKGVEEGIEKANIANAQKMLLDNMKISVIMEITNLPKEKVEELKQEMIKNGQLKEKKKKIKECHDRRENAPKTVIDLEHFFSFKMFF